MLRDISVIKIGGKVISRNLDNFIDSLVRNYRRYGKIILVHGGGDIITSLSRKLGVETKFVISPQGIRSRFTSKDELEVYIMGMAYINSNIVSRLNSKGILALGLNGAHGRILLGLRKKRIVIIDERGRKRVIDGGYTGRMMSCDAYTILRLLEIFDVLVISPLIFDPYENTLLNIDADEVASSVSLCVEPNRLIYFTDTSGIYMDGSRLQYVKISELDPGKLGAGMNRKILSISRALNRGILEYVYICNGLVNDPLNMADSADRCTRISK